MRYGRLTYETAIRRFQVLVHGLHADLPGEESRSDDTQDPDLRIMMSRIIDRCLRDGHALSSPIRGITRNDDGIDHPEDRRRQSQQGRRAIHDHALIRCQHAPYALAEDRRVQGARYGRQFR